MMILRALEECTETLSVISAEAWRRVSVSVEGIFKVDIDVFKIESGSLNISCVPFIHLKISRYSSAFNWKQRTVLRDFVFILTYL